MSLSMSKCWYSNNCLHFLKCAVPFSNVTCKDSQEEWKREREAEHHSSNCDAMGS